MLPIIFAIVSSIFVFRTARDNGFNAVGWTIASIAGFILIQFAIALFIGILMGIGIAVLDWSPSIVDDYSLLIGIVALIPSVIYVLLIMKYVNRVPDSGPVTKRNDPNSILAGDD